VNYSLHAKHVELRGLYRVWGPGRSNSEHPLDFTIQYRHLERDSGLAHDFLAPWLERSRSQSARLPPQLCATGWCCNMLVIVEWPTW